MTDKLEALLADRKQQTDALRSDRRQALEDWKRAAQLLLDQIEEWLKPLAQRDYLRMAKEGKVIVEDEYGQYKLHLLRVRTADGRDVVIEPVGLNVIGGLGRIDVKTESESFMVVREADGGWVLAKRRPGGGPPEKRVWSEEDFRDELADLLEG
ncbi:MAG: hypothetical protein ABIL09_12300 [Gemmatimonadota bacterium]